MTIGLAIACAIGAAGLLSYAWFQIHTGYLHGDALIFQAVGRGMLNGYTPYADLFETKPPGVFLLHALSWKLVGSQLLVSIATALALIGVAARAGAPVLGFVQGRPAHERRFLCLLSVLFGIVLALYMSNQAGGGLAETYGAYFGIVFLTILITPVKYPYLKSVWLGFLLLLAVGFKEPFLLSILAGAILLIDKPGEGIAHVVVPIMVAAALGLIGLFIFGLFEPFFQVYLPHMLGFHVYQHDGSMFIRALEIWRTFMNLGGAYSWGLAVAIALLLFNSLRIAPIRTLIGLYLTLLAIAVGGDFYGHHFVFAVPFYVAMWWMFFRSPTSTGRSARWIVFVIAIGLVYAALFDTQFSYADRASAWRQHEAEMRSAATTIDEVMDNCNWEKYLQVIPRVGDAFAYTDHVPYGPIFLHYTRFIGAKREYQTAFIRALNEAKIALVLDLENANLSQDTIEFMGVHFSEQPPACVSADFVQPEPYSLLFRNN